MKTAADQASAYASGAENRQRILNAFDKQSVKSLAVKKPRAPKKPKAPHNPRAPKAVDIFVGSRIRLWRMRREMT